MSELVMMINTIFLEPILPESRYMIDKIFNPKSNAVYHITCPSCGMYLGNLEKLESNVNCENCNTKVNTTHASNMNFFVIINPCEEIGDYLIKYMEYYQYVLHERVSEPGHIKDIYDGKCYKEFVRQLPNRYKYDYVTAILNTDGANKFECSQYSLWPIYLMPNELPPQERFNSIVTCGLWFGDKPDLRIFLGPLVDMINNDSQNNISIKINGEDRSIRSSKLT